MSAPWGTPFRMENYEFASVESVICTRIRIPIFIFSAVYGVIICNGQTPMRIFDDFRSSIRFESFSFFLSASETNMKTEFRWFLWDSVAECSLPLSSVSHEKMHTKHCREKNGIETHVNDTRRQIAGLQLQTVVHGMRYKCLSQNFN